jgi:hypothetical protein
MKLRQIAHSRTGDKGNISNISLIAFDQKDYRLIENKITAEVVRHHFRHMFIGEVFRYELPQLYALNFVIHDALSGGVTASTALDKHGKSLSSYLLDMEIPD